MSEERIERAVQRIEAALARIADCADTIRPAPPSVSALVVKHENLSEKTGKILKEIDSLISNLEGTAR
ncbi:MAG: hypothetical protein ACK5NN_10475 [Sphingomonadaceae bacterium]